jgi:hypothetical protein
MRAAQDAFRRAAAKRIEKVHVALGRHDVKSGDQSAASLRMRSTASPGTRRSSHFQPGRCGKESVLIPRSVLTCKSRSST